MASCVARTQSGISRMYFKSDITTYWAKHVINVDYSMAFLYRILIYSDRCTCNMECDIKKDHVIIFQQCTYIYRKYQTKIKTLCDEWLLSIIRSVSIYVYHQIFCHNAPAFCIPWWRRHRNWLIHTKLNVKIVEGVITTDDYRNDMSNKFYYMFEN